MTLSRKQQAFINEYLIDFNATQAAIRAGYSEKSAANIGWENVRKPEIAEVIQKRLQEKAMSADEVVMRLAEQGRASIEDFISFNHAPYPTFTLDLDKARRRGVLHLIKKVKYDKDGNPEIELLDPQKALELLGKHHKLFTDKVDVHHSGGLDITGDDIAQARQRAAAFEQELLIGNGDSDE